MQIKLILLLSLLLILTFCGSAQDVIYRKNSGKTEAVITGRTLQSRSYRLYNVVDTSLHLISTAAIDSIIYSDGNREIFAGKDNIGPSEVPKQNPPLGRNLVGVDIGAFAFYNTLSLSYEYLILDNKLGIKAMAGWGFDGMDFYDYEEGYSTTQLKGNWTRIGLDYYIFPQGTFRIGTGLHFNYARYLVSGTRYDYSEGGTNMPYDFEEYKNYNNLVLTLFLFYNITHNLAVNAGIDGPVKRPDEIRAFLRAELLLNF